jgi:CIC family chloride channel protein
VAGLLIPGIAGDGLSTANAVLAGSVPLYLLGAIIVVKIFATAGTLGAGGSGGVFAPAVLIGSAAGFGGAAILQQVLPGSISNPADFGLVGICAMLGATTHAPLTSIFLLSELTRTPEVAFQGMVGVAAAIFASRMLTSDTIETMELRLRGIDLHASLVERIMAGMEVRGIMRPDVQPVPPEMPILDFAHYAASTYHKYFPVMKDGTLLGVVTVDDLGPILDEPEQWRLLIVADLLRSGPIVYLRPSDDLGTAEGLFRTHGFDQIPVMEESVDEEAEGRHLTPVGLLHHSDLLQAAARRKLSMELPR